ncbi:hypothetical protein [Sorangium sp. So ce233]|uniref:hypothetical protein n=1 Tax=Sorangium sp. So ce233 TaxID=3133290 RepID=UPI003F62186F
MKKMTGKDITTDALLSAIGDGATLSQILDRLGFAYKLAGRACDQALQREKRAARISFNLGSRKWMKNAVTAEPKPKRGGRKA